MERTSTGLLHHVVLRRQQMATGLLYSVMWGACSLAACQKAAEQTQALTAPVSIPSTANRPSSTAPADKPAVGQAEVSMGAIGNSGVSGQLVFTALANDAGVRVHGEVRGLKPGPHGMHVHEVGRCDGPDGMLAGGHFNPTAALHGKADLAASHVGDMGNIVADARGIATVDLIKAAATLHGPSTLIGRSLIVHADVDDLTSQPAGKSGPRVGCGVIGAR